MAKKNAAPAKKPAAPVKKPAAMAVSTAVRHSAIPKVAAPAVKASVPKSITFDDIARKAYFISTSGTGGSETDNWLRAEAELRNGR